MFSGWRKIPEWQNIPLKSISSMGGVCLKVPITLVSRLFGNAQFHHR